MALHRPPSLQSRPFLSATEALTFVAFGQAESLTAQNGRLQDFYRRWRASPPAGDVLALLEARAGPTYACPWHPFELGTGLYVSPFASPKGPELARAIRADHRGWAKSTIGFPALLNLLRAELQEHYRRQEALNEAERIILEAMAASRVRALGAPARSPRASRELIPGDLAADPIEFRADAIDLLPETESDFMKYGPPRTMFVNVVFRADEISALRPVPEPIVQEPVSVLLSWMTTAARDFLDKNGAKAKRDDLVRDCVSQWGCRFENAEAAYSSLSPDLRRTRGQRDRRGKSAG